MRVRGEVVEGVEIGRGHFGMHEVILRVSDLDILWTNRKLIFESVISLSLRFITT